MIEGLRCSGCGADAGPGDAVCRRCGRPLDRTSSGTGGTPARGQAVAPRAQADLTSDATRFLCVGAHLDDDFSQRVVKELFGQTFRAVAPSYGFDLGLVARHCLAARHRRRVRDVILGVLGLAMFLKGAVPTVVIGELWWVTIWAVGWLAESAGNGADGVRAGVHRIRLQPLLVAAVLLWLAFGWSAVVSTIVAALAVLRDGPLAVGPSVAAATTQVFGDFGTWLFVAAGWVALYTTVLVDLTSRRRTVVRELRREAFLAAPAVRIPLSTRLQQRLDAITWGQLGNVTVYSGYDPFVGTGVVAGSWSFAMPLVAAPGRKAAAERFSVPELVGRVRERVASIGADEDDGTARASGTSEDPLYGLVVSDHVFVSGLAIDRDRRFLPRPRSTPRTGLSEEEIEGIVREPRGVVRHYCSAHVRSWRGEIVTSLFLHFSTDGEKLYFECVKRVLPPVRRKYHSVDSMATPLSGGELFGLAREAGSGTIAAVVRAPIRMLEDLVFDLRADAPPDETVIDYGARMSVRELARERDGFHNYFQELDFDKHHKIVESRALEAIAEFLDERGFDTSEFRRQQANIVTNNTITNNTVNQTGASNTIGATSFGPGSSATQSGTIGRPAPAAGAS